MQSSLNIRVRDSVFEPGAKGGQVQVRSGEGKRPRYRVNLFLEGEDLPYVRQVTYVLHPTFKVRESTVRRLASNPNCKLTIWTWGLFSIEAIVKDKRGKSYRLQHTMAYDAELDGLPEERYKKIL